MLGFIERILGKNNHSTKAVAKDRLRAVILLDRADIPGPLLEQMRKEIFVVLSRYVDIDESALDVNLEKEGDAVALVANIPIRRVKVENDGQQPRDGR